MQMRKSSRHTGDKQRKAGDDGIDLDEKIRRIRENNKALERRHKEIENDKLHAMEKVQENVRDGNKSMEKANDEKCTGKEGTKESYSTTLKGVQRIEVKKPKGRGQRLLEMSKEPLKAGQIEKKLKNLTTSEEKIVQKNSFSTNRRDKPKQIEYYTNRKALTGIEKVLPPLEILSASHNPLMDRRRVDMSKTRERTHDKFRENERRQDGRPFENDNLKTMPRNEPKRFNGHTRVTAIGRQNEAQSSNKRLEKEVLKREEIPVTIPNILYHLEEGEKEGIVNRLEGKGSKTIEPGSCQVRGSFDKALCTSKVSKLESTPQDCEKGDNNAKQLEDVSAIEEKNEQEQFESQIPISPLTTCSKEELETVVSGQENHEKLNHKPTLTINASKKKLSSSNSVDDFFLLSPLDGVPDNWGDCEFDEDVEPVFSIYQ